jgi:hypothetical protein
VTTAHPHAQLLAALTAASTLLRNLIHHTAYQRAPETVRTHVRAAFVALKTAEDLLP